MASDLRAVKTEEGVTFALSFEARGGLEKRVKDNVKRLDKKSALSGKFVEIEMVVDVVNEVLELLGDVCRFSIHFISIYKPQ